MKTKLLTICLFFFTSQVFADEYAYKVKNTTPPTDIYKYDLSVINFAKKEFYQKPECNFENQVIYGKYDTYMGKNMHMTFCNKDVKKYKNEIYFYRKPMAFQDPKNLETQRKKHENYYSLYVMDCTNNEVRSFGSSSVQFGSASWPEHKPTKIFSANPPYKVDEKYYKELKKVFCGTTVQINSKNKFTYYQYGFSPDWYEKNKQGKQLSWTADENFEENEFRNIIHFKGEIDQKFISYFKEKNIPIHKLNFQNISIASKAKIDCKKKNIKFKDSNLKLKKNEFNMLYEQVCNTRSKFYVGKPIQKKYALSDSFINNKKYMIKPKKNNIKKVRLKEKSPIKKKAIIFDVDKASKTCLNLGFKQGTKKYKNCIIELL